MKTKERDQLLQVLKERFENNSHRHPNCSWAEVESRIEAKADVLRSLQLMEMTGGEPDIVALPLADGVLTFCDCSTESPIGRRSLCYDQAALEERKANKPQGSAVAAAMAMGMGSTPFPRTV